MRKSLKKKNISIRSIIIIVFVIIVLVNVVLIGSILYVNWNISVRDIMKGLSDHIAHEVYNQIDSYVTISEYSNKVNHTLISNGIIDLSDQTKRERFFVGVLKNNDNNIYSFSYGTKTGEYYGARRNKDGIIEIMKNNRDTGNETWYYSVKADMTEDKLVMKTQKFDPRERDWYIAAEKSGGSAFSPIYRHFVMNDLALSTAWPIYNGKGELQGVLGTHILINDIGGYLERIIRNTGGYAMIVEKDTGNLVANSFGMKNFSTKEDGTLVRANVDDIKIQSIREAYNQYTDNKSNSYFSDRDEKKIFVSIESYHKEGLNWLIISAVPESLLLNDIKNNINLAIIIALSIIAASVLLYRWITGMLFKPMRALIEATEKFASGDLKYRVTISRYREIGIISGAFNSMAEKIYLLVNRLEETVKERTSEITIAYDQLYETKEDLHLILDSAAEGICGIDPAENIVFCNASALEILGYHKKEELIGQNLHSKVHHSYKDKKVLPISECKILQALKDGRGVHDESDVFWKSDGTCIDVAYHSYPQIKDGKVLGAVITFLDISERKKSDDQINYLINHDSLTGLSNRHALGNFISTYDQEESFPIAVIFADINGLKMTNDIFGHALGDQLIAESANILKAACNDGDFVARVSGDEFVILLPKSDEQAVIEAVKRIKSELSKKSVGIVKCSMAIGYDLKTRTSQKMETVMENAENAMYQDKLFSKKSFGAEMVDTIIEELHVKSRREKEHSERVSRICQKIGEELGLPESEITKLKKAGYLHDIGKIVIDETILNKEGKLPENERIIVQQHTAIGYRILNLFDHTLDLADGIYAHHENWDGTGYPKKLKGEEIPLMARILSIAGTYDRILSASGSRDPESKHRAANQIKKEAGKSFDPFLTNVLIQLIEKQEL